MSKALKVFKVVCGISLWLSFNIRAQTVIWDGTGDGINWSDGLNWVGDLAPGAANTAAFDDVSSGTLATTVNAATTVRFLQINQSTTTAVNALSLGANLTLTANNGNTSGIQYGSAITNAGMFTLDLNGFDLIFNTASGSNPNHNLYGTYTFDTAGSRIRDSRDRGNGTGDRPIFNIGSGSNLTVINATASGALGHISTTVSPTANNNQTSIINIASGSKINVSNNAVFDLQKRNRVAGGSLALQVNNSGEINIEAGSVLGVRFTQANNSDFSVNTQFNNQSSGVLNQNGTVALTTADRGNIQVNNAGSWVVGSSALITAQLTSAAGVDTGTATFVNQAGGVIRGAGASALLDYNPLTGASFLNQTLTITNQGIISPGEGHNGSGLASVGTLSLTDINTTFSGSDAILRLDIGGLAGGQFDVLTLTNGALTLDGNSELQLYYVNTFNPVADYSLTILNYGSRTGAFDLLSNLSIFNATGDAANVANYSITYNSGNAVLNFTAIPEPSTYALLGLGLGALWVLRRRRRNFSRCGWTVDSTYGIRAPWITKSLCSL